LITDMNETLPKLNGLFKSTGERRPLWKPGMPEYHGISRNMLDRLSRNIAEYYGISRHFPGIYRNITIFSDGSHATVYKHGRLATYFITNVMDFPNLTVSNKQ
jgi:2-hydroxychromene-2-carboxylate isomerase